MVEQSVGMSGKVWCVIRSNEGRYAVGQVKIREGVAACRESKEL